MDMACRFGETSESTRLKVGSLLYKNDNIIALGTNGTRSGWHTNNCEDESGHTTEAVRHSEIACLDKLRKSHETSVGAILVVSHCPCLPCSVELVEAGIERVFYRHDYRSDLGIQYLKKHGIPTLKI